MTVLVGAGSSRRGLGSQFPTAAIRRQGLEPPLRSLAPGITSFRQAPPGFTRPIYLAACMGVMEARSTCGRQFRGGEE
jgi:hypothetical protein